MRDASFSHHGIILDSHKSQLELKQCSLRSVLDAPSTNQFRFYRSLNFGGKSVCVVGCCNGLVCILYDRKLFMLWNPSTREIKELPEIDPLIEYEDITGYGFGFDCLSGDYKVCGVMSIQCVPIYYDAIVKVYSLETDSWNDVENGDVYVYPFGGGEAKFASGKLHQLTINDLGCKITSFDLRSGVRGVVQLPFYDGERFASMEVIEGRLGVLVGYSSRLDVWIMKEYGVRESWEKVVTVPLLDNPFEGLCPRLLGLGPNGEVFLTLGSSFVICYRDGDDGYRHLQVDNLAPFGEARIYVESLVSLIAHGEQEA